jgi:hypothetical protein
MRKEACVERAGAPRPELRTAPRDVRPLTDLMDPAVMRAVLQALRLKQDGTVAAAETQRHKRMTLVNAVRYGIEQGRFRSDPIANINCRIAKTVKQVDPRAVANPAQARSLLQAVSYGGSYRRTHGRRLVQHVAGPLPVGRAGSGHASWSARWTMAAVPKASLGWPTSAPVCRRASV